MLSLLKKINVNRNKKPSYKLYEYKDSSGAFDYKKYVEVQVSGNKKKLDRSWVDQEEMAFVSKLIKSKINPVSGICHGTRRGLEQKWLCEELQCDVIGTEISDTASLFPNTIQWDFHNVKDEWEKGFDFIYSNSLDHSYNPKMALDNWMKCLKTDGVCVLAHSIAHGSDESRELDPFGVDLEYLPYLILIWSENRFHVSEIHNYKEDRNYIILENNS